MDTHQDLAPASTGQPSQPQTQEQPSPSGQPRVQEQHLSLGESLESGARPLSQSTVEKPLLASSEGHSPTRGRNDPYSGSEPTPQTFAPVRSSNGHMMRGPSRRTVMGRANSGLDWIVPVEEKPKFQRRTIGERLEPTIINAEKERAQYAIKAKWTSYALNIAIGLQVLLGSLTTGLSAALSGRQVSIGTCILGGMSTIVASYLARTRGSNEPELSITRVKDLDQFLRDCLAFKIDYGHEYGTPEDGLNDRLESLRRRFEELLGNADGQRKLSPPI